MRIPQSFTKKQKAAISKVRKAKVRRIRNTEFIIDYLSSHPCIDCGEDNIIVLDFDHRKNKRKGVSILIGSGYSIASIQSEIDKCDVRCANCHRIKTAKQRNSLKHSYKK